MAFIAFHRGVSNPIFAGHSPWNRHEASTTSFHNMHNVVDRRVLDAMWEELARKVEQRDQHNYLLTTPI